MLTFLLNLSIGILLATLLVYASLRLLQYFERVRLKYQTYTSKGKVLKVTNIDLGRFLFFSSLDVENKNVSHSLGKCILYVNYCGKTYKLTSNDEALINKFEAGDDIPINVFEGYNKKGKLIDFYITL